MTAATIGGAVHMLKKEKEENERKQLDTQEKTNKERYENNVIRKYITSKSKEEITIKNKDDLRKAILSDVRKIVALCNKSPDVKKKFEESFKKHFTEDELKDKDTFDFNGLHVVDDWDYTEIIDGNQEVRMALSWFIDDLVDVLKEKWSEALRDYKVTIGSGDGDEGCIYLDW